MGGLNDDTQMGGGGSWRELGPQKRIRGQMNNDEVETPRAGAHVRLAVARALAKRGLVAFLAFAMAFGTTPAQLWADGAAGIAEAVAEATAVSDTDSAASEGDSIDANADATDSQATSQTVSSSEAGSAVASDASTQAASSDNSNAPTATPQSGDSKLAVAVQSDASVMLSDSAKVYIQDSKDKDSSYSTKSGVLKQGDILWANMYDEDDDDWYSSESSVANPGTWTYTWFASSQKSDSASDYTEVVGNEQSLTVTDALAGKYLICKVTADGKDYYGPAKSYGTGLNANYIPGPVLAAGQANLYSVKLSNSSPSVGDTITATAYTDYSTVASDDVNVTYSWYYADSTSSSAEWTQLDGQTGSSLTLTEDLQGKYVKVVAGAGVNEVQAKTSDAVMAPGAIKLGGVVLDAPSTEVGATLTAKAYTGSSYSPSYVDSSKVTYTWKKYKGSSSPSYSTSWETIEGQTGDTLVVTDDLAGCYISVSAKAGANTVDLSPYSAAGPFKLAGAVDISAVSIVNPTTNNSVFTVGDTAKARAKEKGSATGVFIDADKLNFQWLSSDTKNGTYAPIDGATDETLELTEALEGKYIKCKVTAKIGSSEATNSRGCLVGASTSINITKVTLDATGKAEADKPLTATATAASGDVTNSDKVTWSWYYGDSSTSCDTRIEGATTNVFAPSAKLYAGKYAQARANGGYGDVKSDAVAIVEAGAVELYGVTVEGASSNGAVHVGNQLTAKATKGNSYTSVGTTDTVHYQWQYADTKSTSDAAFKNIDGAADSATYTVSSALVGKYIRVIATSENSVKSTQKTYYGSMTSVDPVGPVTLAGQYTLKSVEPAETSSATLNVGTTLTPKVRIPGSSSWSDSALPEDAKLTITWYAKGAEDSDWTEVTDGVDAASGALTITDALVGKSLKLEASALDNTVTWTAAGSVLPAGEYDLLRVVTSPQLQSESTNLVAGDSVSADAYAKRVDGSTTNGVKLSADDAEISWYAADASDAADDAWTKLDVTGGKIQVPDAAGNKYLKAVATSGSSKVEVVSANKIIKAGSLKAAVQKLDEKNVQLTADYSEKGVNVNDLLKAQLEKLGFDDVDVKVAEGGVLFRSDDARATVGISDAQDDTNGAVTFFYMNPDEYTGYNLDRLRSADVVFELSRVGEETEYYQPNKAVKVAWDEDKLQDLLDEAAEQLVIGYASGDTAKSVTQNLTLPYKAGANKKFSVEWSSSDTDALFVSGYGWNDYTGKVARKSSDREVTLTAKVSVPSNVSDGVKVTGEATHTVTVKGDPDKVASDKADLQKKVDAAFTYDNVKDFVSGETANKDGLAGDIQMPRPKTIGVDGKYCSVVYSASTDDVTFNGYKGTVYQPLPGSDAATTKITVTVTDKSNSEVTASKTLDYTVAPQEQADLDAELTLMDKAKAGYAEAILNGQDASTVTSDMHAFQKAYLDGEGNLAWSYDKTTTDAAGDGIVPVDLPGYDPMSGNEWRLFKSSNTAVVSAENLLVTRPEFNTKITISSSLTSEKYARYAERYPDNETYAKLANQAVSATVTVLGTTGQVSPEVNVTCSVIGVDAAGNQQAWASAQSYTVKRGTTAAGLTLSLFKDAGLSADYDPDTTYGFYLKSITSPFDKTQKLGYDQATGKYWQLFVNGKSSNAGASGTTLEEGDSIVWAYSSYGDPAPTDELSVTCEVIGRDKDGNQQTWAQPTTLTVKDGSNAGELSEQLFRQAGITADTGSGSYGWYLNSITSPFDSSNTLGTKKLSETSWEYWQFFVNGELAKVGAGNYTLKAGDKISWVYGSDGTVPGQISVSMEVIGRWDGKYERWTNASQQTFVEGTTLREASDSYLTACGFEPQFYISGGDSWTLWSMKNPFNGQFQGASWVPFVNGKRADEDKVEELHSGDKVVWVFSPEGNTIPNPDEVTVDPDAERPTDWKADWDGGSNATTDTATSTGTAAAEWTFDWKQFAGDSYANASEPIVVNGYVYLAVNNRMLKIDPDSGMVLATANLKTSISYTSRPVYAKGLIIVPLNGGAVQALTADELTTVWLTDAVSKDAQASTTIAVDGNYAYVGTSDVAYDENWNSTFNNGHLMCINILTGVVSWDHVNKDEGYYWTGATSVDGVTVVPTSAGTVEVLGSTGNLIGSCNVGSVVNSTVVASGSSLYLVSRDGKLHVFELEKQGERNTVSGIKETKTVDLGLTGSACVPTLCGDKMIIGGEVAGGSALAIVDLATYETQLVSTADGAALPSGGIKGAPLVSEQASGTYVYFTVNYGGTTDYVNYTSGGGVYCYKLGDAEASAIYTAAGHNNYCDSPVVCDSKGNLYYINDSGTLFKLTAGLKVTFNTGEGSSILDDSVVNGGKLTQPADPTREGYTFGGWFTDAACTQSFDFASPVTSGLTLFAKWVKKPAQDGGNHGGNGNSGNNGGNGGDNGSDANKGNGSNGSGNGTQGAQAGGSVKPGASPVAKTTVTAETSAKSDSKKSDAKSDDKAGSDSKKSDKSKNSGKSKKATESPDKSEDTGLGTVATAKSVDASDMATTNPLALVGIAVGVIGLALVLVFYFARRRKED